MPHLCPKFYRNYFGIELGLLNSNFCCIGSCQESQSYETLVGFVPLSPTHLPYLFPSFLSASLLTPIIPLPCPPSVFLRICPYLLQMETGRVWVLPNPRPAPVSHLWTRNPLSPSALNLKLKPGGSNLTDPINLFGYKGKSEWSMAYGYF